MTMLGTIVAEIMNSPDFAEIMFLVAFILFIIEFVRLLAFGRTPNGAPGWGYHWLLVVAGLACVALGLLALPSGAAP